MLVVCLVRELQVIGTGEQLLSRRRAQLFDGQPAHRKRFLVVGVVGGFEIPNRLLDVTPRLPLLQHSLLPHKQPATCTHSLQTTTHSS